jgi:hypothetical protein
MMGPKSFPRIVYITSIKGWVHDYTLLGAGYWSGRIWDRTTIRGGTPYAPKAELDEAVEALRGLYRLARRKRPKMTDMPRTKNPSMLVVKYAAPRND